ncbi:MAG: ATP-dependent RecD-like DNA helicase [Desulfobacterales bacterium]
MQIRLSGQIDRITYTNEENGFTIAKVKVAGRRDSVTVVGNLLSPSPGEILEMEGIWTCHPRFGEQFKIVRCKTRMPATISGIKKYLGSGLIKGIGPVMADRIVQRFGKNTLNILEKEIEKLTRIAGIGKKRVEMIKKAWADQKDIRDLMLFLQSHEIGAGYAVKIFKQYGDRAITVIRGNPYRLAMDIFGIGFVTADRIASRIGFSKNSPRRVEAGIIYLLNHLSDEGHAYYPLDLLVQKAVDVLDIEGETVLFCLRNLSATEKIVIEENVRPDDGGQRVYLTGFYVAETGIARFIKALSAAPAFGSVVDGRKAAQWVASRLDIQLADKQLEAVRSALSHPVLVLTGGPGTGKTTTINALLKIFLRMRKKVMLAAPTGRAAKRMNETTGHTAKTIHRLLEYSLQKGGFARNDQKPLDCDILIIDETSMIDTILMYHLLKAVRPGTILVLVGDVNQLPSVGAGNVLMDIIRSGRVPVVGLNAIFRQAQASRIIVNAHRINSGKMPEINWGRDRKSDFYFIHQEDPQRVLDIILDVVTVRIPKRFGLHPMKDVQVLTPMHKGIAGAGNLNVRLQQALNPRTGISIGGREFRVNDKVMQIRNNYDKEVYNGDIGRILRIVPEKQDVSVRFDQRTVPYDYSDLDELVPAYAISIHKSQGSEYAAVVVPILTQHFIMLQRNLLYTAITRGRKLVVLVGAKKALAIAVKNNTVRKRYTYLQERLVSIPSPG